MSISISEEEQRYLQRVVTMHTSPLEELKLLIDHLLVSSENDEDICQLDQYAYDQGYRLKDWLYDIYNRLKNE